MNKDTVLWWLLLPVYLILSPLIILYGVIAFTLLALAIKYEKRDPSVIYGEEAQQLLKHLIALEETGEGPYCEHGHWKIANTCDVCYDNVIAK